MPEAIEALYKNGWLDVNAKDEEGLTLMHCAAGAANIKMMMVLNYYGADLNAKDAEGETPIDWARQRGTAGALEFLVTADTMKRAALKRAADVDAAQMEKRARAC